MKTAPNISPDEALQRLMAGNQRFLRGESRLIGVSREKLAELSRGQHPFAAILGCSDSRVSPEMIFDCGLGELFVIRVAGNVYSPEVAGSIQYAGAHLKTPLLVVLGHQGCGAIEAALAAKYQGARERSRIQLLLDGILPALERLDAALPPADRLARAVELNVEHTLRTIVGAVEEKSRLAEGHVKIVGAVYDLETGRVRFLDVATPP